METYSNINQTAKMHSEQAYFSDPPLISDSGKNQVNWSKIQWRGGNQGKQKLYIKRKLGEKFLNITIIIENNLLKN